MINSGKYQYAEVELNEGIHLVGANNSGKTTLISALQFLYIDNDRSFKFTKDNAVSKRYYFKSEYSYILFECLTANGYMVVGARGTSALGNGEYERFIYSGSYKKSHYFKDGGVIRRGSELKPLLADKGFKILTGRNLQSLLTGNDIGTGVKLNLLPIRNEGGYKKFRQNYKNLLELATVDQDEVKKALIQMCHPEMRVKGVIDLQERFKKKQEEINKIRSEILTLQKLEKYIHESFEQFANRNEARENMVGGYSLILDEFSKCQKYNITLIQNLGNDRDLKKELKNQIEHEKGNVRRAIGRLNKEKGSLDHQIKLLENEKLHFSSYLPDFAAATINKLQNREHEIAENLALVTIEDIIVVEPRLKAHIRELQTLSLRLSNFENTFAKMLCNEFTEEELSRVFAVLNEKVLGQSTDNGPVSITDTKLLVTNLQTILGRIKNDTYSDPSVRVNLIEELKPDLSKYFNMEQVQLSIANLESEIARDEKTLEAAKKQAELKKELSEIRKQLSSRQKEADRYRTFKENESNIRILKTQISQIEVEEQRKNEKYDSLEKEYGKISSDILGIGTRISEIQAEESKLKEKIECLKKPDPDWIIPDNFTWLDDEIEALIDRYALYARAQERDSENLQRNLNIIETQLGPNSGRYESEQQFLDSLKEKLGELETREKAANTIWEKTLSSLHTDLRDLLEDVKVIRGQANTINRDLSKIQISDLLSLRIVVEEKGYMTELFQSIINKAARTQHELFEFSDTGNDFTKAQGPLQELERIAMEKGRIDIKNLFSLKFEVEKIDGKKETYTSLSNVESNGTTITVKVLVNLMLMRGLFDDKKNHARIPFYLDEVTALDDKNRRAVMKKAIELGFTPIIASPDAQHIVNKIYLLESGKKQGLYVDKRNMTLLVKEEA